jgi:hypothetical protein
MYKVYLNQYVEHRKESIQRLLQFPIPEFQSLAISCHEIHRQSDEWIRKLSTTIDFETPVLYYFKLLDGQDLMNIQSTVAKLKSKYSRRSKNYSALPKVNVQNYAEGNNILYVGKTNSNFLNRFRSHLGLASRTTYSLQLAHWACDMGIELELHYAPIQIEKVDLPFLEEMESVLHMHLKPLLGRTGH